MQTLSGIASVRGGLAPPWRTLVLTGLALALYLVAGPAPEAWIYDRAAIAAGELWRLITGHLVHADGSHALWDIAALALLGTLFEGRLGRSLTASLALGVLAIDVWLWWGMPALLRYCGLSGILNSLLAAGLYALWRQTRDPVVLLVAAGAVAKIAFEALSGQAVFTDTAWPSVPSVHGVGFAAGLALAALQGQAPSRRRWRLRQLPVGLPASAQPTHSTSHRGRKLRRGVPPNGGAPQEHAAPR